MPRASTCQHRILAVVAVGILFLTACSDSSEPVALRVNPTPTVFEEVVSSSGEIAAARARDPFFEISEAVNPDVPLLVGTTDADRTPVGDAMQLGGLATETIAGAAHLPGVCDGATARLVRSARDSDLPVSIKWMGCNDDQGSSDDAAQLLDEMLERDAFAIVPLVSLAFGDQAGLNDARVPYFGSGSQYCGIESGFAFSLSGAQTCPVLDVFGLTVASSGVVRAYARARGANEGLRIAHVVDGSPTGDELARIRLLEMQHVGAERVALDNSLGLFPSDDEFAALADSLTATEPDLILIEADQAEGLYRALRALAFSGDVVGTEYANPSLLQDDPDLHATVAGSFQVVQGIAVSGESGAWSRLREDAVANDVDPSTIGLGYVTGYVAMDMYLLALAEVDAPLSAESLHDLINSGWQYPGLDAVACRASWPIAHLAETPCSSMVQVLHPDDGFVRTALPLTEFDVLVAEVAQAEEE